ncbi:YrdB family protein [Enterococcus termitis]|uniref:DUF2568 domain-containing protein n=1 Tax=Enterococcus termitis TaxID=332950 RepID=A0A1E5H6V5_9ENTE|nr:YrdB family protein [Enterococcus termitis]OEG20380.1 hypothetical protein BCR25_00730 [Enterococcus termitis]
MERLKTINLLLAFFIEIGAVLVLGYWGFTVKTDSWIRIFLGITAPVLMMGIWAIWCAPKSRYRLKGLRLFLLKAFIFILVACCLVNMGKIVVAALFTLLVVLNLSVSAYKHTL